MSRDGLLPPVFEKIHPKYKTPSFATIVTGLVVGVPILFTDKTFVLGFYQYCNPVCICIGLWWRVVNSIVKKKSAGRFHLPYINGQFIFPLIIAASIFIAWKLSHSYFTDLFKLDFSANPDYIAGKQTFMDLATPNISLIVFWIFAILLAIVSFIKKYSLIPLMGVITCMYLLTGMTKANWVWFTGWLVLGVIIYFLYGYKKSKLAVS